MEEFDFEPSSGEASALAVRASPELLMPSGFDSRVGKLRGEIAVVLRHAESLLSVAITTVEQHDGAVEAGQLLQVMSKNVAEFYKPIKQAIDQLKQPILDMEHADAESLKTAKERLGTAIQEFEQRQAALEAIQMEQTRAEAAAETEEGELPLPVIVPSAIPAKTRGKVERTKWSAEVVDFLKLVQAVAAGQVLLTALLPNDQWLDKRADSDREGMNIPGVVAHKTETIHFRATRQRR